MSTSNPHFFGRRAELDELARAAERQRVVTVCGPAGVGKTALLREFAQHEGWRLVDLSELDDGVGLEGFIASALGVSFTADADEAARRRALRTLLDELGAPLALDNAEHVAAAVAGLTQDPTLTEHRFVVASRERLGCTDERVVLLDPFEVAGEHPTAVQYLAWRAEQLGGTHALREDEIGDAHALVRRLDGLPLALDLAAARLSLLRPAQLLERLERSADVLTGPQTRSLTQALAASWEAATAAEQRALASLAVLEGPFEPRLAEAVIGDEGLGLLQSLRDRSVVVVDPDGRARLLLSVRDFVRTKLDDELRTEALTRLATHLASRCAQWLEAAALLDELDVVDTMRAHSRHLALSVREPGDASEADRAQCATALAEVAMLEGTAESAYRLIRELGDIDDAMLRIATARIAAETGRLDEADELLQGLTSCTALRERSLAAQYRGDLELAAELGEAAVAQARTDRERGRTAVNLAGVLYHRGDYDAAGEQFDLALRHARRAGDRRTEARALQNLGILHCDQMRLELARKYLTESIERHRLASDVLREAWGHNGLGVVELRANDAEAGIAALERAGELFDRVGHRSGAASARANLAMIAVDAGRWDDGVRYALDAIERSSSEEDPYVSGMSKLCLTLSLWFRGERAEAGRSFAEFEPTIRRDAHVQLAISWDCAFGGYLAATGDERAEEVFSRGEALLGDDEGHDVYHAMFALARCQATLRDLRGGGADREELHMRLLEAITGRDAARAEALRFTIRLLRHEAPPDLGAILKIVAAAPPTELIVAHDLQAFRPPGGEWQSMARSPSLWRLLWSLAETSAGGGGPLTPDELQEATWPGETLTADSAANRLHVSLSKLRKAGLKGILQRRGDGYELADVPITIC